MQCESIKHHHNNIHVIKNVLFCSMYIRELFTHTETSPVAGEVTQFRFMHATQGRYSDKKNYRAKRLP